MKGFRYNCGSRFAERRLAMGDDLKWRWTNCELGKDVFSRMESYKLPQLESRLIGYGICSDSAECKNLLLELKRALTVCYVARQSLSMPSQRIDSVWYQFIFST